MFEGFSPETIDFLWGIRFNNNREWFTEHKEAYQRTLYEPMKALGQEVAEAFRDVDGLNLHVSKIYRDMRMHPSTFYKDSLWFCLRHAGGSWLEHPCLCFEIRPEGYRYGFLFLYIKSSVLEVLHNKMLDHADRFLEMIRNAEKESRIPFDGDRYVRPKPCKDVRLTPFFGMRNFMALCDRAPDKLLFSPALAAEVRKALVAWLPVYEFLLV